MENTRHINIGIVGAGHFSMGFVPLFKQHPTVKNVYITDLLEERQREAAERFQVREMASFEAMLESDIDSIAIFVQRHLHGPLVIRALDAGKHVYCAVPMATTVQECVEIIRLVKEKRLAYMMGETCYYYPCACFCREKHREGAFGHFVYGASQYYHDLAGFDFQYSAGKDWKKEAGIPPMYYPTHSFSMLLSAADTHVTRLSALGYRDREGDEVFGEGKNYWDNPFSNIAALCSLANGGSARVSEFRRVGTYKPSSYISGFYGTKGAYEYSNAQHILTKKKYASKEDVSLEDVSNLVNPTEMTEHKGDADFMERVANAGWVDASCAPIQPVSTLPDSYRGLPNGHMGTHQFLINDFLGAVHTGKLPPCNAWFSARCNIPGLIAYESALRGGEQLEVPDFGGPPEDWEPLYP